MLIESLGWFFIGAGVMVLMIGAVALSRILALRARTKKFDAMISQLKEISKTLDYGMEHLDGNLADHLKPEVSELTFRDRYGALCTVKIIIDPRLDHDTTSRIEEDSNSSVQEFVFSTKAVEEMRAKGVEPDEAVTSILKASGRML